MKIRTLALCLLTALLLPTVSCVVGVTPSSTLPKEDTSDVGEKASSSVTRPETEAISTAPTDAPTEAPAEAPTEAAPQPQPQILDKNRPYEILLIGNSYTFYNEMPQTLEAILHAAGYRVNVTSLTKGGWTLLGSSHSHDELGRLVETALQSQKFDFAVLQEQSTTPIQNQPAFYSGVRNLHKKLTENGATPVLYATWGRKSGSSTLRDLGIDSETMTWQLATAYETIGQRLDIPVAHVGLAFRDIYTNQRRINLYDPDLSHPSAEGSYLAAMTIFARITGVDPTTVAYNGGLSTKITQPLKEAAYRAVFETPDFPS